MVNGQTQIRVSVEFQEVMVRILGLKISVEGKKISMIELTREIVDCDSFKRLQEELIENSKTNGLKISFDRRSIIN